MEDTRQLLVSPRLPILTHMLTPAITCLVFLQAFWQPHNRISARRIQNMGWREDGGLWLLVRGGGLFLSKGEGVSAAKLPEWSESPALGCIKLSLCLADMSLQSFFCCSLCLAPGAQE